MSAPFHEVQFPADVSWGAKGGGEFLTWANRAKSGKEQRNICREEPQMKYSVSQIVLDADRKATLLAFAKARLGMLYGFRFKDFFDFEAIRQPFVSVLNPLGATSPHGPWQMLMQYSDSARICYRRVFKPCTGLIMDATGHVPPVPTIYNGLTLLTAGTDYTIDYTTGQVTMLGSTAPTNWSGEYDVPVRFDEDTARFLLYAFDNTDWPDIKLVGHRMGNVTPAIGPPATTGTQRPPVPRF